MITMYPENGLCNRMVAVASGYALAKDLGHAYRVLWNKDLFLGAKFRDLFCPLPDVPVRELNWEDSLSDRLRYPHLWFTRRPLAGKLTEMLRGSVYDRVLTSPELHALLVSGRSIAAELQHARNALLFSYEEFHSGAVAFLRCFQPLSDLMSIVDQETRRFGPNTIGVHIRKADRDTVAWNSPLEQFEARMAREAEIDRSAAFFLATDSAESEARVKAKFGPRVLVREKSRSRETVEGMRDAVIDLYLLSRTRKILGSPGSTFSTTAAAMGAIPLALVRATRCP